MFIPNDVLVVPKCLTYDTIRAIRGCKPSVSSHLTDQGDKMRRAGGTGGICTEF